MSEPKLKRKKSAKKKHGSSHGSKQKNEETHSAPNAPSSPSDQRPQSPEPNSCSPAKRQKTDSSFTRDTPQSLPKKTSPVSLRKHSSTSVKVRRTSAGSCYYQLCGLTKKHKEKGDNDQSDLGSSNKKCSTGDSQPASETSTPRRETQGQKNGELIDKINKKIKRSRKNMAREEQVPTRDLPEKIPQKLGTWINSFKIVTLPKNSNSSIAARSQAFQESCKKQARLKKSKKEATSSSQKAVPVLAPSSPIRSSICGEKEEYAHESHRPSFTQKSKGAGSSATPQCNEDSEEEMQIVEELHTARSEKKLDLAVAQTCGELTSMDIDSPEDSVHNFPETTSCSSLLIVIDTNIMIGHLQFIKTLKTMYLPGFGKPILIIPWVVLQELDYMKNGKLLQSVKHKAIPAVQFIYICLKNQDPNLWGQSMQQASQKMYGLNAENNDDRVLHCCIQFQKLYPSRSLLLCSDDKNLCNKALVSDVKAVSKADLLAAAQNLIMTSAGQPSHVSLTPLNEGHVYKNNDTSGGNTSTVADNPFRNVISDLEKCLGLALSRILETEMKVAFDDLWVEVLFLKPPWTLSDLLQCFKKHWIAVFGMIMKRDLLESIDFLHENLCKGATIDYILMELLLKQSSILLNAFSSRSHYDGALPQACSQISQLVSTTAEVKELCLKNTAQTKGSPYENTAPEKIEVEGLPKVACEEKLTETQNFQNAEKYQKIWIVLENLCNTVANYSNDIFQKFACIQPLLLEQPATSILPLHETFLCLQKLMVAVKNILEGIQRIIVPNSTSEDVMPLYSVLLNNEIHVADFTFSAVELYECLSQNEYRQKLTIGCYQLSVLEQTMKTVNESICSEAKGRGWM
ncbi:hypothetical protein NDU88_004016 [Pleurodeles waltl]|uniref:Transcriptional protein SWT1 n=1 Tax=Pleurodeles waltl TaxID=8319 RepID=A0AAV7T7Y0_PLEWA|nr:hypothetical protein NDU88_004016 [Pleurodeles waltl]